MTLTEQINIDIKVAMKAREKEKLDALRAIKAALLLEATKEAASEINQEAEQKLLLKLHKQRIEAAEIYKQQNRLDLKEIELAQASIIENYLPKQLSGEELTLAINDIIKTLGASGINDLGKVMGAAIAKLQGKADGKRISEVVKKLLTL